MSIRRLLAVAAFSLAVPVASFAQGTIPNPCPPGQTLTPLPGGTFGCVATSASAPEIGASSSVAGIAVLMGGVMMLRGRKRNNRLAEAAA